MGGWGGGGVGPSLELVFPITRDKHQGIVTLVPNGSEIPEHQ